MIYKVAYAVIGHREREVVGRILEYLWDAYRAANVPNKIRRSHADQPSYMSDRFYCLTLAIR
ncbi:hypothetical protein [Nostoc sp.]|uniref:hypothetical protein n=1 Tax=Nostoc sp. TaxID=1180 RepID=UPI002FF639C8